jgi:Secretion system C-terminal sorting domain
MKQFHLKIAVHLFILFIFITVKSTGQCTTNYLINGGFDSPTQPLLGNNLTGLFTFNGWTMTGGPFNVIKVDGVTAYGGGPDVAVNGNQYIDITSAAGDVSQNFTLTCISDLTFNGSFSHREAGGANFDAYIEIRDASTNALIATSSIINFTTNTNQETWFLASGTATAVPAGTYKFAAIIGDFCNFDAAFLCAAPGCVLPIKLNSFDGAFDNCSTKLKWVASNETNSKEYQIEYSADGRNFNKVGIIPSNKSLTAIEYQFAHNTSSKKSYYRLKHIDDNGAWQYSKVILLNTNCSKSEVTVYPNPATEVLNINITSNSRVAVSGAQVFDCYGRKIIDRQLKNGTNSFDIKQLPAGMYLVTVNNGGDITNQKIMIH